MIKKKTRLEHKVCLVAWQTNNGNWQTKTEGAQSLCPEPYFKLCT